MTDTTDFETWLIELGDEIIRKHAQGSQRLSPVESAIYDLWAVDYAVRNAGDMEALEDLRPTAATDLANFLRGIDHSDLASYMLGLSSSGEDCDSYYDKFDELCVALKAALPGS